ncbi:hypothetical protein MARTHA_57 [Arthrobacter phage Martha]|uniref:Uncharacterized protein n=2 Tax=Marthavirus martha TaxID=1980950 RepID=A0A0U4B4P8_9CAUD|nr:hypothetical protein FDH49_gp57 [Arthrobacter phage Martha]ALY09710.1 hypothetical protein MARTHA_57 [Arthrobacter phage Martha]ALY10515.1 hypothetical protein TAEYOUNG_58 [Arthrobacter phage TaeYoung]
MKYGTKRFSRIENSTLGQGETVEYFDAASQQLIAYVDYNEDGSEAAVKLFAPGSTMRGTSRYDERPADKAEGIVNRHLHKQGYNEPIEAAEQPVDNEIMDRAQSTRFKLQMTRQRMKQSDGILSIDVIVGFDGIILFTAHTDGRGLLMVRLDGRTIVRQTELDRNAAWELSEANIKSIDAELKRLDDEAAQPAQTDEDDTDLLPIFCPRCGINKLDHVRPAMNARSRYAPVYICSPCGTHEALSPGGIDLWHDTQHALAALQQQAAKAAAPPLRGKLASWPDDIAARS